MGKDDEWHYYDVWQVFSNKKFILVLKFFPYGMVSVNGGPRFANAVYEFALVFSSWYEVRRFN